MRQAFFLVQGVLIEILMVYKMLHEEDGRHLLMGKILLHLVVIRLTQIID